MSVALLFFLSCLSAASCAVALGAIVHSWRRQQADGKRIRVLTAHIEGLKRGGTPDFVPRFVIKPSA